MTVKLIKSKDNKNIEIKKKNITKILINFDKNIYHKLKNIILNFHN